MKMALDLSIGLVAKFGAIAIFLQAIETLRFHRRKDFAPHILRVSSECFTFVFLAQLFFAVTLLVSQSGWAAASVLTTLVAASAVWTGALNGGADYLTFNLILCLTVALNFPSCARVAIGYLAVLAILSYFVSGIHKIKSANWWRGDAIRELSRFSVYSVPVSLPGPIILPLVAGFVILFECTFPLAIFFRPVCLIYLGFGMIFHLINVYVLGLNRFFFIWLATYPAIFWLADFYSVS